MLIYFDVFVKIYFFIVGIARDRPSRYGTKSTPRPPVGRGPVPRQAAVSRKLAGETRSDARVASEGPRAAVIEARAGAAA